jgi:hypothetical protein
MSEPLALFKPSATSVVECASYRRPFRSISFNVTKADITL